MFKNEVKFFFEQDFIIGDMQYHWLTIEEVQKDKVSWERNKNVILKLKDEYASITNQFPNSCEFQANPLE